MRPRTSLVVVAIIAAVEAWNAFVKLTGMSALTSFIVYVGVAVIALILSAALGVPRDGEEDR